MKRTVLLFTLLGFFALSPALVFCDEKSDSQGQAFELNSKTGFPEIKQKPFITFDWGLSASWVTRIQFQKERSNFVLGNTLLGAYFTARTQNMKPIDSFLRIAAYYPLTNTFNKVPQKATQVLLYAFDAFYAPVFEADMWKYVRIEFAPGIHFLYQLSDNWHYMSLGGGVYLGVELPLSKRWTVLVNGMASLDYPNLGSNATMFPLDLSYQYQVSLGARYSKKKPNSYSYITSRKDAREALKEQEEAE